MKFSYLNFIVNNFLFCFFFFFILYNNSVYYLDPSIIIYLVFFVLFFFCLLKWETSNEDTANLELNRNKLLFNFHQFSLLLLKFMKKKKIILIHLLHVLYKRLLSSVTNYILQLKFDINKLVWSVFVIFSQFIIKKKNNLLSYISSIHNYYTLIFVCIYLIKQ